MIRILHDLQPFGRYRRKQRLNRIIHLLLGPFFRAALGLFRIA